MEASLPPAAQLAELAACVRNIADDLVASNGGFPVRVKRRIADILTPLDSAVQPTHPWQEFYSRLVRAKSPSKAEDDLRDALGAMLAALGHVHRHPHPEHASRLQRGADRLERIAATCPTPRKSDLWHRPVTRREIEEQAQREAPRRIERAVRELQATLRTATTGRKPASEGPALIDPIPIVEVVRCVGHKAGRSDKLAGKMQRRNYLIQKLAGKLHCQRADAFVMFPHHRASIEKI